MKVKELIERLNKLDPDSMVSFVGSHYPPSCSKCGRRPKRKPLGMTDIVDFFYIHAGSQNEVCLASEDGVEFWSEQYGWETWKNNTI